VSVAPTAEPHPALAPLVFLLGTWRGSGAGHYPTIEPFAYVEEISFVHVGKPWLLYTQRTRHAVEDRPLHAETGYFRPTGNGVVEVVMAYPTGHVEIAEGTLLPNGIDIVTGTLVATPTAKRVDRVERRISVDGDELHYTLAMAAVGEPLTPHLEATLLRADRDRS
jgi:THAP4-like, heme-binding beta-barrel domain